MQFRAPAFPWIIIGLIAALSLHGLAWFFSRAFALSPAEAFQETQRQVILALFWMVCVIAFWVMQPPRSRMIALLQIMACAFVVCLLGSVVAFFNWMISANIGFGPENLLVFSGFALMMMLGQLFLALPSATLLQQIILSPERPKAS